MNKLKRGCVCAVKNCANKSYSSNKSFFRFPADPARGRIWAMASNRKDLIHKLDNLYGSYRLCNDHFEPQMFANKARNQLISNANPTLFPSLEGPSGHSAVALTLDHTYSRPRQVHVDMSVEQIDPEEHPKKIRILKDVVVRPAVEHPETIQIETPQSPEFLDIDRSSPLSVELLSPSCSSQTSTLLSSNTPRKRKLRENMKDLTSENKRLKKEVEQLRAKCENIIENVSLDQYFALTYKFHSSLEIASFINLQVSQCQKEKTGRRYSNEFKYECLAMYYAGPKLYKKFLMKKFCLPSPQTLFKLIRGISRSGVK